MYIDKMPWKSKKFIAFGFVETILTGLLVVLFATQVITLPVAILGSVFALGMCSLAIGYILGQASLDRFISGVSNLGNAFGNRETELAYDDEEGA